MKTLTINVPDSVDEAEARWGMAKSLFEKGSLSLEQASSLAQLAPTYFKMKLEGIPTGLQLTVSHNPTQPFDPEYVKKIGEEMDVQESWEELVAMIGK
jgi:hypothetical protein